MPWKYFYTIKKPLLWFSLSTVVGISDVTNIRIRIFFAYIIQLRFFYVRYSQFVIALFTVDLLSWLPALDLIFGAERESLTRFSTFFSFRLELKRSQSFLWNCFRSFQYLLNIRFSFIAHFSIMFIAT